MSLPIDEQLRHYLFKVMNDEITELPPELMEEFLEECKNAINNLYNTKSSEFRLRMSNIGQDARTLWLAKKYGGAPLPPEFAIKMVYGHIVEKLFIVLLKAAGVEIQENNEKVSLQLDDMVLQGEYDIKINGEHYDFKTASDWSYNNKFINVDTVVSNDTFGYGGQAVAYSLADTSPFGGWFVINKSTGDFKLVDGRKLNNEDIRNEYINKFNYNVRVINGKEPVPECTGVEDETYYKKPTGNKVLGNKCKFCQCKDKCHPGITYRPSVISKANPKPWVYYVELNNTMEKDDE